MRLEVVCNNLKDFKINKSIENLPLVREKCEKILDRFASAQSGSLNAHFDYPLLEIIAQPVIIGETRIPGIKLHETRMIRLLETMMHYGTELNGWPSKTIYEAAVMNYELTDYKINQLRYDLRKLKAHGLVERKGNQYKYVLTDKGRKVAVMFVLFNRRLFGPLANSLFKYKPDERFMDGNRLERAYYQAYHSIEKVVELLAA